MYARQRNIWWNVRGSGAGSIVAYAIGITNLDPLRNKLIFERFLNPGRVTMPDFDLDFPDDQREELIRYTVDKYGIGAGGADRHLRPHEGPCGRARRRPGDGCPAARGGPYRQDDPRHPRQAGDDQGSADRGPRVLLGRPACSCTRARTTSRTCSTPPANWRGWLAIPRSMPRP